MEKAVGYLRVSTQEQATEGVSLAAQAARVRAYCQANDLDLVEVVREEGVSGTMALAERPGGQALLRALTAGEARHVVALKLDRLFRDAEDALHQTRAWDQAEVVLHLVDFGGSALNTASAMGRFMLTMLAAFAEFERNLIAERTAAALQHKKQNREAYAPTPLGFDRDGQALVENEAELETVALVKKLRREGLSYGRIARRLNVLKRPTKQGGTWWACTVRYLLRNDLYEEATA
jgi:DNA invertase Pin-like site-specific DNA recombinase